MEWVDRFDHSSVRLSLDLWQFGHDPATPSLLPDLVPLTAIVQLADCCGLQIGSGCSRGRARFGLGHW